VDAALNAHAFTADLAAPGQGISTNAAARAVVERLQAHGSVPAEEAHE
jgi:3-isopropylmalate dehydrogenase